jgi:DNA-binding phage protein
VNSLGSPAARLHDEAVIDLLRDDPAFADEYLAAALKQANAAGGRDALQSALRHVVAASAYRLETRWSWFALP